MSNEHLDDIAVLTTLERLRQRDMLADADRQDLEQQLKSEWGRKAAAKLFAGSLDHTVEHDVLKRFSASFISKSNFT
jgi:hypothetical protein